MINWGIVGTGRIAATLYPDLVNVGTTVMNVTGQALEVICIIMGVYLTVNIIIAFIMNHFNARIMRAPQ